MDLKKFSDAADTIVDALGILLLAVLISAVAVILITTFAKYL